MRALSSARALLDVPPDADVAEVTRAYWRQARRLHPDRSSEPDATERFRALHDAYRLTLDAILDPSLQLPPQDGGESAAHGEPAARTAAAGLRVHVTQVDHDPSGRDWTSPANGGLADGVWVVAGPVRVRPHPAPDAARSSTERRS